MEIEIRHAGLRLLLHFPDDGSSSADIEFGLDTEALLENLFYFSSQLGAARDRDNHFAFLLGRLYRSFPFEGGRRFCLPCVQPCRSEQDEVNPSTEPLEDFRSDVKLPCDRFIVKNPHCLTCKCATDEKSRELGAIDRPLSFGVATLLN